jgi:predicted site-specific integrase-resolvase
MKTVLPYPPPWQDAETLCAHVCIGERTLDAWVRQGILPPAKMRGGKRMWKWSEVERYMEGNTAIVPEQDLAQKVHHATRQAAHR